MTVVVDQFAGPGGWDEAAKRLGLDVLGIELDAWACKTREAAGHKTLQADVAALDPCGYSCEGLIGSPPCPTFSGAGNGGGQKLMDVLVRALRELAEGRDTRYERREEALRRLQEAGDKNAFRDAYLSLLAVEPLRWALALEPEWVALEQVPEVLPLWEVTKEILIRRGYSVWTGVLSAERYGVPQTRKRAILMASRARRVAPPEPTHQAYVPGEASREEVGLFGTLAPWISMAEALEWEPATVNTRGNRRTPGGNEFFADRPSWALTEKVRSWKLRPIDSDREGAGNQPRPQAAPAPTVRETFRQAEWITEDEQHAIDCDLDEDCTCERGASRLTASEAAILQGFRPDYPWQGSRSAQFHQIGNAIPPPLARAVLAVLVG